jgi:segregation and condensation protein A
MEIELAGEFFVLAATLMRIKAQMLLRRDDDTDEDPREGLVRSLLEYKKMVEAARVFKELEDERARVYTRPVPEVEKQYREEPTFDLSLFHLMKAFREVMVQFEAAEVREIELEEYTLEEKIAAVTSAMRERSQLLFTDLFEGLASRMELIVTFMAILELIKHGHVKARQEDAFSPIWLYPGPNFGQSLESVEDWFETTGETDRPASAGQERPDDEAVKEGTAQTEADENGPARPR